MPINAPDDDDLDQDDRDDEPTRGSTRYRSGGPQSVWVVCLALIGVIALVNLLYFLKAETVMHQAAAGAQAGAWAVIVYAICRSCDFLLRSGKRG